MAWNLDDTYDSETFGVPMRVGDIGGGATTSSLPKATNELALPCVLDAIHRFEREAPMSRMQAGFST